MTRKKKKKPLSESNAELDLSKFAPSVRYALAAKNIDPSSFKGTGRGGRIKKSDLQTETSQPTTVQTSSSQKFSSVQADELGSEIRREKNDHPSKKNF